MQSFIRYIATSAACVIASASLIAGSAAQAEYPDKPVQLMVGFSAGGGVDTYGRTLANLIQEELGQPMVVVNKPGAAGMIAAKGTADSSPDGYTLYITNAGSLLAKALMDGEKSKLDPLADLEPLAGVGQLVSAMIVPAGSPFKTSADMVKAAKANPGKLKWAHPGRGSLHMIAGAAFLSVNGIDARDIPFKGGSKARNAVVGEQVDFGFAGIQTISGFESKVRALGVTMAERDVINKDVPTFAEMGLEGIDISGPMIVFGPNGMPDDVKNKLTKAITAIASGEKFRDLLEKGGLATASYDGAAAKKKLAKLKADLQPVIAGL
ncbi:MAG: tripartite tricarboxylate transporter substrate binding protein [Rhodospirillales bacterium]